MPIVITCPTCSRALQLPEDLIGQQVKCPGCQTTFTAQGDGSELPPSSPLQPEVSFSPPPVSPPPEREYERSSLPSSDARALPRYYGRDDEARFGRGRYEDRSNRSEALGLVSGPATALQTVAGIQIALAILGLVGICCFGAVMMGEGDGQRKGVEKAENAFTLVTNLMTMVIAIVASICVYSGAEKMKNLESHGWAMTASILAMILPCSTCCWFLGLPFGIWALAVINKPEVRNAFRSMSDPYR